MVFISFSRILPSRLLYNILKNKKFDEKDKGGRDNRNVEDFNQIYCNLFIYFILFHLHFMCFHCITNIPYCMHTYLCIVPENFEIILSIGHPLLQNIIFHNFTFIRIYYTSN